MQDAYVFSQFAATVFLIVFSIGLGYLKLRYFGFGFQGILDRQVAYEERRKTELGRKAHRPLLIRYAEDWLQVFGRAILPAVVNGTILIVLGIRGLYALVPVIAIPLAVLEFAIVWYVQSCRRPLYQQDFEEYLRLTAEGNRFLDGQLKDWDVSLSPDELVSSRLLSGGKIVTLSADRNGHLRVLRLFYPFSAIPMPPSEQAVRVFYAPEKEVQGKSIDGVFLGYQRVERSKDRARGELSYDEYAKRRTVS